MSNDTKMTAGSIEFFRSKNCAKADYYNARNYDFPNLLHLNSDKKAF